MKKSQSLREKMCSVISPAHRSNEIKNRSIEKKSITKEAFPIKEEILPLNLIMKKIKVKYNKHLIKPNTLEREKILLERINQMRKNLRQEKESHLPSNYKYIRKSNAVIKINNSSNKNIKLREVSNKLINNYYVCNKNSGENIFNLTNSSIHNAKTYKRNTEHNTSQIINFNRIKPKNDFHYHNKSHKTQEIINVKDLRALNDINEKRKIDEKENTNTNINNTNTNITYAKKIWNNKDYVAQKYNELLLSTEILEKNIMNKYLDGTDNIISEIEEPQYMKDVVLNDVPYNNLNDSRKERKAKTINASTSPRKRLSIKDDLFHKYNNSETNTDKAKNKSKDIFFKVDSKEYKNIIKKFNTLHIHNKNSVLTVKNGQNENLTNSNLKHSQENSKNKFRNIKNNSNPKEKVHNSKRIYERIQKSDDRHSFQINNVRIKRYKFCTLKNNDKKIKNSSLAVIKETNKNNNINITNKKIKQMNKKLNLYKQNINEVKSAKRTTYYDYNTYNGNANSITNYINRFDKCKKYQKNKASYIKVAHNPLLSNNRQNNKSKPRKAISKEKDTHIFHTSSLNENLYSHLNKFVSTTKIDEYDINENYILGIGSFAEVKLGIHKHTQKKYAIKIYDKSKFIDVDKINTLENEISILKQLNHVNIMKLYDVIGTQNYLYLILEYIDGISLLEKIQESPNRKIPENECKILFRQIVKAILYCQNKNICHRDIKLENILVLKDDTVKVIDFGFAIKCDQDEYQNLFCGTTTYMAPEIVNKENYIPYYSDIWSLGVLLYTMLYGIFPFQGKTDEDLFNAINNIDFKFPEDDNVSKEVKLLIQKIFVFEPSKRLALLDILLNKWFKKKFDDIIK